MSANIYFIPLQPPPPRRAVISRDRMFMLTQRSLAQAVRVSWCVFLCCGARVFTIPSRNEQQQHIYRTVYNVCFDVVFSSSQSDWFSPRMWLLTLPRCALEVRISCVVVIAARPPLSLALLSRRATVRGFSPFLSSIVKQLTISMFSLKVTIYIRSSVNCFCFWRGWVNRIAPSSHHRTVLTVVNLLECDSRVLRDILCWDRTSHLTFVNKRIVSFLIPASCTSTYTCCTHGER